MSWTCDGKRDCRDNSDESLASCAGVYESCRDDQFQCLKTRKCIPVEWLCDSDYDCGSPIDESDETLSKCRSKKECSPNQTKCTDDLCIETELFCDGKFDCVDDEYKEFCGMSHFLIYFGFVSFIFLDFH